jgi:hypothetical protein
MPNFSTYHRCFWGFRPIPMLVAGNSLLYWTCFCRHHATKCAFQYYTKFSQTVIITSTSVHAHYSITSDCVTSMKDKQSLSGWACCHSIVHGLSSNCPHHQPIYTTYKYPAAWNSVISSSGRRLYLFGPYLSLRIFGCSFASILGWQLDSAYWYWSVSL